MIAVRLSAAFAAAALVAGCAYTEGVTGTPAGSSAAQQLPTYWQAIATENDRWRVAHWRDAFTEGLEAARAAGHGPEIDAAGALLQPDAGLSDARPPDGDYRCRFIKLGSRSETGLAYVDYPYFRCTIAGQGETLRFVKETGSQRPYGTLYDDGRLRMVFLGVLELGDETRPHVYGRDELRDMAGTFERIGEARWRLVLPYPHFESLVDVIEIVPAQD